MTLKLSAFDIRWLPDINFNFTMFTRSEMIVLKERNNIWYFKLQEFRRALVTSGYVDIATGTVCIFDGEQCRFYIDSLLCYTSVI